MARSVKFIRLCAKIKRIVYIHKPLFLYFHFCQEYTVQISCPRVIYSLLHVISVKFWGILTFLLRNNGLALDSNACSGDPAMCRSPVVSLLHLQCKYMPTLISQSDRDSAGPNLSHTPSSARLICVFPCIFWIDRLGAILQDSSSVSFNQHWYFVPYSPNPKSYLTTLVFHQPGRLSQNLSESLLVIFHQLTLTPLPPPQLHCACWTHSVSVLQCHVSMVTALKVFSYSYLTNYSLGLGREHRS